MEHKYITLPGIFSFTISGSAFAIWTGNYSISSCMSLYWALQMGLCLLSNLLSGADSANRKLLYLCPSLSVCDSAGVHLCATAGNEVQHVTQLVCDHNLTWQLDCPDFVSRPSASNCSKKRKQKKEDQDREEQAGTTDKQWLLKTLAWMLL